ncbi:MAG: phosphoglucomutase/phosphomannomutase family protein [Coriobacteriales bacterium]|jgi:phosphomannomutase|nr:phosphoglucomutase/phosphomannomutase family protein [Coriobacteriales bacterium]
MGVDRLGNPEDTVQDTVHFGTDGWRAIIGDDFNPRTVARVADSAARVFGRRHSSNVGDSSSHGDSTPCIIVGYDCRLDAGRYAVLVASIIASYGFEVVISDRYCPTPALCWTIARNPHAVGGVMLTSSHNPAEYLGIKLRMADGGASPEDFTNEVEDALASEPPACFGEAFANFEAAQNGTPDAPTVTPAHAPYLQMRDIVTPYLAALETSVDRAAIEKAALRVVVDPLFGAGRVYLAELLRRLGVEVAEVNSDNDPTFNGLHPEPIPPWIEVGAQKVVELGYDACFVTDGDADRIGAIDGTGTFVTSHRILALLIGHLAENRGQTGRVVRTQAGSNLLRRQCDRLGLTLTSKPIGFKWIYEEMLKGDVLIGGEESGGMGIPTHVRERDGLLMALMLTELMAQKGQRLHALVDGMLATLGTLEYARRDLRLSPEQKDTLLATHIKSDAIAQDTYYDLFAPLGEKLVSVERTDGIKFNFASDGWLLVRPSGTEPLVRVYAEAETFEQVEALLTRGCALAQGDAL